MEVSRAGHYVSFSWNGPQIVTCCKGTGYNEVRV